MVFFFAQFDSFPFSASRHPLERTSISAFDSTRSRRNTAHHTAAAAAAAASHTAAAAAGANIDDINSVTVTSAAVDHTAAAVLLGPVAFAD